MATTSGNQITLSATDLNYTLTAPGAFSIFGNALTNNITGNDDANLIYGGNGNDALQGDGGNDSLHGGSGSDTLDGGAGNDYLAGGADNDAYVIDSAGDIVVENANQGVMDVVYTATVNHYTLTNNVEYLTFLGAEDLDGNGNALANRLLGNAGNNVLSGAAGDDALYGAEGNDTLLGGDGNDVLNGQQGQNALRGGAGNDRYYITVGQDSLFEEADQGNDTVYADASFTLAENFENLTFTGSSHTTGRGNDVRNTLIGNDGDNVLYGEGGVDSLDGRGGMNTLVGGLGDDIYTLHSADNVIVENAGEGVDTVWLQQPFGDYTLQAELENLNINLAGQETERMAGNDANNYLSVKGVYSIDGKGGNDTIVADATQVIDGGDGRDNITVLGWPSGSQPSPTVHGGAGDDTINHFAGAPAVLYGDDGNDTFNFGGSSGNVLNGGQGNDGYVFVNSLTPYNNIIEEGANGGMDTVKTDISFSLDSNSPVAAYVQAGSYVENLYLAGTGNIDGYGNAVGNYLYGNSGNNLIEGRGGNDYLIGYGGNDTLLGGDGNDTLSVNHSQVVGVTVNQLGAVALTGGAGNDTFWLPRGLVGDYSAGANQISITDFVHDADKIMLSIGGGNTKPGVLNTLTAGADATLASLLDQAAAASASTAAPALTAFVFAGNTYLVLDQGADAAFNAGADWAVKIVGEPTLTLSDFTYQTLA